MLLYQRKVSYIFYKIHVNDFILESSKFIQKLNWVVWFMSITKYEGQNLNACYYLVTIRRGYYNNFSLFYQLVSDTE